MHECNSRGFAEALGDEHGGGAGPGPHERLRQLLPRDVAVLELPDVVRVREGAVAARQHEGVVVREAVGQIPAKENIVGSEM